MAGLAEDYDTSRNRASTDPANSLVSNDPNKTKKKKKNGWMSPLAERDHRGQRKKNKEKEKNKLVSNTTKRLQDIEKLLEDTGIQYEHKKQQHSQKLNDFAQIQKDLAKIQSSIDADDANDPFIIIADNEEELKTQSKQHKNAKIKIQMKPQSFRTIVTTLDSNNNNKNSNNNKDRSIRNKNTLSPKHNPNNNNFTNHDYNNVAINRLNNNTTNNSDIKEQSEMDDIDDDIMNIDEQSNLSQEKRNSLILTQQSFLDAQKRVQKEKERLEKDNQELDVKRKKLLAAKQKLQAAKKKFSRRTRKPGGTPKTSDIKRSKPSIKARRSKSQRNVRYANNSNNKQNVNNDSDNNDSDFFRELSPEMPRPQTPNIMEHEVYLDDTMNDDIQNKQFSQTHSERTYSGSEQSSITLESDNIFIQQSSTKIINIDSINSNSLQNSPKTTNNSNYSNNSPKKIGILNRKNLSLLQESDSNVNINVNGENKNNTKNKIDKDKGKHGRAGTNISVASAMTSMSDRAFLDEFDEIKSVLDSIETIVAPTFSGIGMGSPQRTPSSASRMYGFGSVSNRLTSPTSKVKSKSVQDSLSPTKSISPEHISQKTTSTQSSHSKRQSRENSQNSQNSNSISNQTQTQNQNLGNQNKNVPRQVSTVIADMNDLNSEISSLADFESQLRQQSMSFN